MLARSDAKPSSLAAGLRNQRLGGVCAYRARRLAVPAIPFYSDRHENRSTCRPEAMARIRGRLRPIRLDRRSCGNGDRRADDGRASMNERVKHLSLEARKLPVAERAELIDDLLASLEAPDAGLDALWAQEAERRVQLLDNGEMPTRDAAQAIADLRRARGA